MLDSKDYSFLDKSYGSCSDYDNVHKRTVSSTNVRFCRLCDAKISPTHIAASLSHMFLTHGPEYAQSCPLCTESDIEDVQFHLRTKHFKQKPLYCKTCPAVLFNYEKYKKHKESHKSTKKFHCKICKLWFSNRAEIKRHKANHESTSQAKKSSKSPSESQSEYKLFEKACDICGEKFEERSMKSLTMLVSKHKRKHYPKLYQCRLCKQKFKNSGQLRNHQAARHTEVRPYECDFKGCHKRFKSTTNLNQHKTFHQAPKLICDHCGGRFHLPHILKQHAQKCMARS